MGFELSFYLIEMFDSMGFFWNHRIKKWMQTHTIILIVEKALDSTSIDICLIVESPILDQY